MQPTPAASFLKFLVGFLTFLSVSFGVTYAVTTYSAVRDVGQAAAAAKAEMLRSK